MITPHQSLKTRLRNGETVTGIFITEFRTPNIGLILDAAGYDFAIFDMEHCSFTMQDLSNIVPGFRGCRCQPLVRVPAIRREFFQSVLDIGITGIVVPMIESAEEVRECTAMMKYPPHGKRGLSFCCPHTLFQEHDREIYTNTANEHLLLVVQIETATAFKNLDSILSEPGIDVAFIGNTDLSLSLGTPNNLETGPIHDAVRYILQTAMSKKIVGGGNFVDPKFVGQFYNDGLRFISLDSDVERLIIGLKTGLETVQSVLPKK
ncbi:MAG: hypothetical protein LBE12_10170 [Planctomycetaceae bacterium]|jgi:2-keto-3-deoxy-L-rhamnonate aldolase RhmA|nr:hypothetical protein [Planctomycetaceae bacterium]